MQVIAWVADVSRNRQVPIKFNSGCRSCQPTHVPLNVPSPRGGVVGFTFPRTFRNVRLHPSVPGSYDGRKRGMGVQWVS